MSTYTQKHREYYLANKEAILAKRLERERVWINTPRGKFSVQKRKAKQRKINWELSFEEWWNLWQESGKWGERGDTREKYVMCRYNDTGPYSIDNVYIATMSQNTSDFLRTAVRDSAGHICKKDIELT